MKKCNITFYTISLTGNAYYNFLGGKIQSKSLCDTNKLVSISEVNWSLFDITRQQENQTDYKGLLLGTH